MDSCFRISDYYTLFVVFPKTILPFFTNFNVKRKLAVFSTLFIERESVLDFGCGDLSLTYELKRSKPFLSITGIDVIEPSNVSSDIPYVQYDGNKIPFQDKSFDTVLAFYVLHHCEDAEASFEECLRVANKRVILVESVPRHRIEVPFMKVIDWFFNLLKPEPDHHMAHQFLKLAKWRELFEKFNLTVKTEQIVTVMPQPPFLPTGRSYLFVLHRRQ